MSLVVTINVVNIIARNFPQLHKTLKTAHANTTVQKFVKRALLLATYVAATMSVLFFFLFAKQIGVATVLLFVPIIFIVAFFMTLMFVMQTPKGMIRKRQREIEKDVLFAGRYLLVKMESGAPLYNSLIDASKSYGVGAKYFREIVEDIETGRTIEQALENAREYNASLKFKKILQQLIAALKTGTDVTGALRSTLKRISADQLLEIKAYGKKLNSLMLFYMVLAVVVPSLGVTLFILIASFLELDIGAGHLFAALFFLGLIQLVFIGLVKAARPLVDL